MIEHAFDGILCISYRKSNDNSADSFYVVMDNTSGRDGVFRELEIEKLADFQSFYILFEIFGGFFQGQGLTLPNKWCKVDLSSFLQYFKG